MAVDNFINWLLSFLEK
jgi:hypothetical protein